MAHEKWRSDTAVERLAEKIQIILVEVQDRYTEVKELQVVLDRIREILRNEDKASGDVVKRRFFEYITTLELRGDNSLWDTFAMGLNKMLRRWANHLFFAYNDKDIPKTNNQMEQAIKRYKMRIRQLTKKRNTSDVAVRHGIFLVFLLERCDTENIDILELLYEATPAEYLVVKTTLERYHEWTREIGLVTSERRRLIKEVEKYI